MTGQVGPWRVALLAGGESDERQVSLWSGMAVHRALESVGHQVVHLDPATIELSGVDWRQFDVAFLALHGRFGEDGQVQRILADQGVRMTGCSAEVCEQAFRKSLAKVRFRRSNVPTPEWALFDRQTPLSQVDSFATQIGYPLVVKPDAQGSSLGVSIVSRPADLPAAIAHCFEYDALGLIERYIGGTEWTVGLLGRTVLPAIRIETAQPFYNYDAKYLDDSTQYCFDHGMTAGVIADIEQAALGAALALQTTGVVRVDLRLDEQHRPWVLEVNTIPGMTDHSLIPKAAAMAGLPLSSLCEWQIAEALLESIPSPHAWQGVAAGKQPSFITRLS